MLDSRLRTDLGHACACRLTIPMRTTVELKDDLRAKLLEVAAMRGEKGFSSRVNEAVEAYLRQLEGREHARRRAVAAIGSLTAEEGQALCRSVEHLRAQWR